MADAKTNDIEVSFEDFKNMDHSEQNLIIYQYLISTTAIKQDVDDVKKRLYNVEQCLTGNGSGANTGLVKRVKTVESDSQKSNRIRNFFSFVGGVIGGMIAYGITFLSKIKF